jgi:7,8-dihydropterin-6-yl-methyl-4-(beta-D-ribofuranosyl)aminobenzene 5'-phosphate synthase
LKVTVVMDNSVPVMPKHPFMGENGFSLLLEVDGKRLLFDTGYSQALLHNLSLLNVHPSQVDSIILSHGHTDHTGGLYHILRYGSKEYPLYAHPGIFSPRYTVSGDRRVYVGIPYSKEQLSSLGVKWQLGEKPVEVVPGLWFSGQIPRRTSYETGDKHLIAICGDGCECTD